jgi:hypothetical protein
MKSETTKGGLLAQSHEMRFITKVGFPAYICKRAFGIWCGYVGVQKGHSAYAAHYDNVDVDVHGGLTFSGRLPYVKPNDIWWLGFDCGHFDDFIPGLTGLPGRNRWTLSEVRDEVEKLAAQLAHDC